MKQMILKSRRIQVLTTNSRTRVAWTGVSQIRYSSEGLSSTGESNQADQTYGEQFRTPQYQAEKKLEDFPTRVLKKFKKLQKRPPYQAAPHGYRKGNQQAYKNLVYKWFLEAYPESLSRNELAGKLRAHPKKVKTLILDPLCQEGKLFKWGSRVAPNERYMPNVKAPEYYEVTGEKGPVIPDVNEEELMLRVQPKNEQAPKSQKTIKAIQELPPTGEQKKMIEQGWQELYEDTDDEEEDEDDEEEDETTTTTTEEEEEESQPWSSSLQDFNLEDDDLEGVKASDISDGDISALDSDSNEDDGEFLLDAALDNSNNGSPSKTD